LIDANALKAIFDERYDTAFVQECTRENKEHWNGYCTGVNWGRNTIADAPTVDALVLPCKVGDAVWTVAYNKVYKAKVVCIRPFVYKDFVEFRGNVIITYPDPYYSDGRPLTQELFAVFGKDTFLTEEEAKAGLAKMDGGNEDA
jgi:hypothetical protein